MRLAIALVVVGSMAAQSLPISMSYQGETALTLLLNKKRSRKKHARLGLVSTTTCNESAVVATVPTARIDQQIESKGMVVMAPPVVAAIITEVESKDWKRILVDVSRYAAFGLSLYAASSKANLDTIRALAPTASVALQQISDRLLADIPASRTESLNSVLFTRELVLVPGGCGQVMRIVGWRGQYPEVLLGNVSLIGPGVLAPIRASQNINCAAGEPCKQ